MRIVEGGVGRPAPAAGPAAPTGSRSPWLLAGLFAHVLDACAIAATAWLVHAAAGWPAAGTGAATAAGGGTAVQALHVALLAAAAFTGVAAARGTASRPALLAPPVAALLLSWLAVLALVLLPAAALLPAGPARSAELAIIGVVAPMAVLAGREALAALLRAGFAAGRLPRRRILVLAGTSADASALARRLRDEPDCLSVSPQGLDHWPGPQEGNADLVVVQSRGLSRGAIAALLGRLRTLPVPACFVSDAPDLPQPTGAQTEWGGCRVFLRKRGPLSLFERLAKRGLDCVLSALALALLLPLIVALAAGIRLRTGDRVLKPAGLVGIDGKGLRVHVFADCRGRAGHERSPAAARPSPAWAGLSRLPLLLAVLRGDLSLVGPHPLRAGASEVEILVARYAAAQGLKPGLAHRLSPGGPASDGVRTSMLADLAYCDQWSLGLDLAILGAQLGRLSVPPDAA